MNQFAVVSGLMLTGVVFACSGSDNKANGDETGTGGSTVASTTGGQVGVGGTDDSHPATSAGTDAGGSGGTGGSSDASGGTTVATQTSGTSATGGVASTGGTSSKSTATGGVASTGGTSSKSTGGTSTGGTSTSGTNTSGCGVLGSATGVQNLTIQVAGQERQYVLSIPTTYNPSTPLPVVFAFHGLGGTGTLARQYFGIERSANNQAIFVYPTGLPNADAQNAWTLTQTGVDVQYFDALRAELLSKYCIDPARVYVTGHSFGGLMTNALGCFRGDVIRGIAPVAGMPPFGNATCKTAVAAWIAHGDNDATVDFTTGGIATRDLWLKLNTCTASGTATAVEPSPCVAYPGCSSGHAVHWCVHQDGHNWPSFAAAGIWAFFASLA